MRTIASPPTLDPAKFRDPAVTVKGERRATVALSGLKTLWINTGTLCNLACRNCYIESTPRNDRLAYISAAEVAGFLDEIERDLLPVGVVGFTGGEPVHEPRDDSGPRGRRNRKDSSSESVAGADSDPSRPRIPR